MEYHQLVKTRVNYRHPKAAVMLFLVTLASSFACNAEATIIKQRELLQKLETGPTQLIIDVRSRGEYQSGHVPGAINIPHFELASRLGELPVTKDLEIVTYCERGPRAGVAENILRQAGFTAIRHLEGDMHAWRHNGLPIEQP